MTVRTLLLTVLWLFAAALPLRAVNIICSSYPVWLMTRAITNGAGNIAPELLMPSNSGCAHDYLPSVRDMRKACEPDTVLIINGLKLDDHIAQAIKKSTGKLLLLPPALRQVNSMPMHLSVRTQQHIWCRKSPAI